MSNLKLTTFDQSKGLKEIGFDWPVNECFHPETQNPGIGARHPNRDFNTTSKYYSRPTLAEAQKWLIEKHGIYVYYDYLNWRYVIADARNQPLKMVLYHIVDDFEDELSAGIDRAINIVKERLCT